VESKPEVRDNDYIDLPRIAFRFDNRSFARLHQLIRRVNDLGEQESPVAVAPFHDIGPAVDEEEEI
jgi:hypothetical protein